MSEARKATLKAVLEADSAFMALATGGVHTAVEMSRKDTPAAFDANGEILPSCLVKFETTTPIAPYTHGARAFAVFIFYQRSGLEAIDLMRQRAYELLHDACIDGLAAWSVLLADDSPDGEDPGTGWGMLFSRYELIIDRAPS